MSWYFLESTMSASKYAEEWMSPVSRRAFANGLISFLASKVLDLIILPEKNQTIFNTKYLIFTTYARTWNIIYLQRPLSQCIFKIFYRDCYYFKEIVTAKGSLANLAFLMYFEN